MAYTNQFNCDYLIKLKSILINKKTVKNEILSNTKSAIKYRHNIETPGLIETLTGLDLGFDI